MPLVSVVVALNCAASESRLICIVFAQTKAEKNSKEKGKVILQVQPERERGMGREREGEWVEAVSPVEFDWNTPASN